MTKEQLAALLSRLRQQLVVWLVTSVALFVMRTFVLPTLLTFVFWIAVAYTVLLFLVYVVATVLYLRK